MVRDVGEGAGDVMIVHRRGLAAAAGDEPFGRHAERPGGRRGSVHQRAEQFGRPVAERFRIVVDAGKGDRAGPARRGVADAEHRDVVGHAEPEVAAGVDQVGGDVIVEGEDRRRSRQTAQLGRQPAAMTAPVVQREASDRQAGGRQRVAAASELGQAGGEALVAFPVGLVVGRGRPREGAMGLPKEMLGRQPADLAVVGLDAGQVGREGGAAEPDAGQAQRPEVCHRFRVPG